MGFQAQHFDPMTFAQANPFLTGFGAGQQLQSQGLLNQKQLLANQIQKIAAQFAQPEAQQELLKNQLNNQILQPQAQYAPQMELAKLALAKTMPGYQSALTGQANSNAALLAAHANLLRQTTPYDVQKAQADVYSDPLFSRANQNAMLQNQAQNNPQLAKILAQLNQPQGMPQGANVPFETGMAPGIPNMQGAGGSSPLQNQLLYGNPLGPFYQQQIAAYGKGLGAQQEAQAKDYSKDLTSASSDATDAYNMKNSIEQFNDAYNKSEYKGNRLGGLPSAGLLTPPGSGSPEQSADKAAANMQALVLKLMHTNKMTNYELQFAGGLKLGRTMNPDNVKQWSDFLGAKSNQLIENQAFLNAAKNQGVDPYTANTLWQQYINQRPVYDFSNNKPNTQFQNTWSDYLNPQSINSAQTGKQYIPIPQFDNQKEAKNWFKSLNPSDRAALLRQQGSQQ